MTVVSTAVGLVHAIVYGSTDRRVRATWRGLHPIVLFVALGVGAFALVVPAISPLFDRIPGQVRGQVVSGVVLWTWLVGGLAVARRLDRRPITGFGLDWSREWGLDVTAGLAIGVVMAGAPVAVALATGHSEVTSVLREGAGAVALVLPVVLFMLVGNVVSEEVLFRGVMLQNFAEGLSERLRSPAASVAVALAASSVLFGTMHLIFPSGGGTEAGGIELLVSSALFGLVWGAGYAFTGRVALPIGMHFGYNVSNGLLFSPPPISAESGMPSLIAVASTSGWFWESFAPTALRAAAAAAVLLAWLYFTRGELSIDIDVGRYESEHDGQAFERTEERTASADA